MPWPDARRFDDTGHYRPGVTGLARSCGWLSMYVGLPWIHERGPAMARRRGGSAGGDRRRRAPHPARPDGDARHVPDRRLDGRRGAGRAQRADLRDRPDDPGPRRDPDQHRLLHDRRGDRARRLDRRAARRPHARDPAAAAAPDDPRPGRRGERPARRPPARRIAGPAQRPTVRRRGSRSAGASSGTPRGRSSGRSSRAWSWRSCSGSATSPTTSPLRRGAVLPGGDLRTLYLVLDIVVVLVVGSVVTWLVVPQPRGSGTATTRSPWSAALGFFAAVPVCYLVLVVVVQVLDAAPRLSASLAVPPGAPLPLARRVQWDGPFVPFRGTLRSISSGGRVSGQHARTHPWRSDEQHVALPKLYGAPAYARPAPVVEVTPRPFDPDDLPIEAVQTDEEREIAASLPAHAYAPGGAHAEGRAERRRDAASLTSRPLSLRALAGRILGQPDN